MSGEAEASNAEEQLARNSQANGSRFHVFDTYTIKNKMCHRRLALLEWVFGFL